MSAESNNTPPVSQSDAPVATASSASSSSSTPTPAKIMAPSSQAAADNGDAAAAATAAGGEPSRAANAGSNGTTDTKLGQEQEKELSQGLANVTISAPSPSPPPPKTAAGGSSDPVAIPTQQSSTGTTSNLSSNSASSFSRLAPNGSSIPGSSSSGVIVRDMASPSSSASALGSASSPSGLSPAPRTIGGGGGGIGIGQSRSPGVGQQRPMVGGAMSAGALRNRVGGLPQQQAQRLPPSLQAKMDALQRRGAPGAGAGGNGGTPGGGGGGEAGAGPSGAASAGRDPSSMSALLAAAAAGATRQAPQPPRMAPPGPGGAAGGLAARRAAAAAAAASSSSSANGGRPGGGPVLPASGLSGGRPSITGIAGPSGQRSGALGGAGGGSPAMGAPGGGLSKRRPGMGMTLSSMGPPAAAGASQANGGASNPGGGSSQPQRTDGNGQFGDFGAVIDPTGRLNFNNKAILTSEGVDFSNGQSFKINMNEMVLEEELGRGNYGTVQRVYHRPTKVVMAMKEIRLELDQSKLNAIIMELDILHRAVAPEIVEFYGAFLIESCVYYCMEYMDAGSLDNLHGNGVPEDVLCRISKSVVTGLGFLKDSLQIMHRDVKPTNILVNTKGQVKLCDFGVSGQLEKSLARTNIGCQSYMAPERIKGGGGNDVSTYTVASDVWSVGLSIIEVAQGSYPYPPETYSNVFAQLTSIVHGPSPRLPEQYSATAQDFVAQCLLKQPEMRPTYGQLLKHKWMLEDAERDVDMVGWVAAALEARAARRSRGQPVSSSAPEGAPPPQPDARVA